MDSEPRKKRSWFGIAYWFLCVALWLFYFFCMFLFSTRHPAWLVVVNREVGRTGPGAVFVWGSAWTDDPVLKAIIKIVLGIIMLCLLPGVIATGVYLAGITLVLAFGGLILDGYAIVIIKLASTSTTGMVLAVFLAIVPPVFLIRWIFRRFGARIGHLLRPIAEPIYGIFFDWWLTPLLKRRKEKRMMNDLHKKRSQCEALVLQLQTEYPEAVADMGRGSLGSDTWLERLIERFTDRDRQKNIAERTKLIGLAKEYFSEYRAMLVAQDELTLVGTDARIRRMQRQKEELGLKNEIANLQDDGAQGAELRRMEAEKKRLTLEHELGQLKKKVAGVDDSPYKEGMKDKRARRMVDIEDALFETLEHPIQTEMDARVLYKTLRKKIDRHPELSDEDKDEMLEHLKQRFRQFSKDASTSIFEED